MREPGRHLTHLGQALFAHHALLQIVQLGDFREHNDAGTATQLPPGQGDPAPSLQHHVAGRAGANQVAANDRFPVRAFLEPFEHIPGRRIGLLHGPGGANQHHTYRQLLHQAGHPLGYPFFLGPLKFPLAPGNPQLFIQGGNLTLQITVRLLPI